MKRNRIAMKPAIKVLAGMTAGLFLGLAAPAQATFFTSVLTSGVQNDFEDQSREAFVDVDGNGSMSVGDVLVGFVRFDDKTAPNAVAINNRAYAIFTQQVATLSPLGPASFGVTFAPTTVAGLTLDAITGVAAAAGNIAALYSDFGGFGGVDLITTSPGNVGTGGAVTLADYFNHILATGTLDMLATTSDLPICGGGDCFDALVSVPGGILTTALITTLPSGVTIASYVAGLEVTLDPTGFTILDATAAGVGPSTGFLTLAELAISNGAVRGAVGVVNSAEWTNASELTALPQCGANIGPCGFVDDADFSLTPLAIPEPGSLALLGAALVGLGAAARRKSRS